MRTLILLLCTTVFSLNSENSFSQKTTIIIDQDQLVSIDQVFKIIKQQTEYCFMYPNELFKNAPKVQLKKGETTVIKLLKKSLSGVNFNFKITKKNSIVIKKKAVTNDFIQQEELQKNEIKGTILDESTNETLPYATIRLLNTKYYTITNEDGKFELSIDDIVVDSLEVRFLGYITKKVSLSYFKTNLNLYLLPQVAKIEEVLITNRKRKKKENYTINLLNRLIQKYRNKKSITNGKAFLSLTSSARNIPIEQIEGFYNSEQSLSSGLENLSIKSGRFGQNKSFPFYSLDNTIILKNFQPFKKNIKQILPIYPGNMTKSSVKSRYKISLDDCLMCDLEDVSITFTPQKKNGRLFSGKIIFDEKKLIIKKIELKIDNPETYGLSSVGEMDVFTPKKIELNIVFNPLDLNKIQHLEFEFDIQYNSKESSEYIKSHSFLYFYDYGKPFNKPYFIKSINFKNDYDKIVALQASEDFWKKNYQFPKSYNDIRSLNFMKEYGYLINYDNAIPLDYIKYIKPSVISWDNKNRITWESIKYGDIKKTDDVDGRILNLGDAKVVDKISHSISEIAGKKFKRNVPHTMNFSYVLDFYKDRGNNKIISRTVFDRSSSFFKGNRTKNKLVYFNLIFDIYEYHRKNLNFQNEFINQMTYEQVQKMYADKFNEATLMIKKMNKETSTGTNYQNLIKWNNKIKKILLIDNFEIISKKD